MNRQKLTGVIAALNHFVSRLADRGRCNPMNKCDAIKDLGGGTEAGVLHQQDLGKFGNTILAV